MQKKLYTYNMVLTVKKHQKNTLTDDDYAFNFF